MLDELETASPQAAQHLLPLVYDELRRIARAKMAQERGEHTLQATALVHEAYLRLIESEPNRWANRRHFFAAASEAMRRILIEHARRKGSLKRGGDHEHAAIHDLPEIASPCRDSNELLALDEALTRLEKENPAMAQLVKVSFFGGFTLEESAIALGISRATAYRHWTFARAWLLDAIGGNQAE